MNRKYRVGALPEGYAALESDGIEITSVLTETAVESLGNLMVKQTIQEVDLEEN
jgi:hypothetical protein